LKRIFRFFWLALVAVLVISAFSIDMRPMFGDTSQSRRDSRLVLRYRTKVDGSTSIKDFRQELTPEEMDEDFDGDGLSNAEEQEAGTDICNADTDHDGLNDLLEVSNETNPKRYQASAFSSILSWGNREACYNPASLPQLPMDSSITWQDNTQTPFMFISYTGAAFNGFQCDSDPFILLGRGSRSLQMTIPISAKKLDTYRRELDISSSDDVTFILVSYDANKNQYTALASTRANNNDNYYTLSVRVCQANIPLCIVAAKNNLNNDSTKYYALSHYMQSEPERFVCIHSDSIKIVLRAVPSSQTRLLEVPSLPKSVRPNGWYGVINVHESILNLLLKANEEQAAHKKDHIPLPQDPFRLNDAFPWLVRRFSRFLVENYSVRPREVPLGDAVASAAFNEKIDNQEVRQSRRTVIAETKFNAAIHGFADISQKGYSPAMAELAADGFNNALGLFYLQNGQVQLDAKREELKNLYLSQKDKAPVSTDVLRQVNDRLESGKVVPAYLVKGGRVHAVVVYAAEQDNIDPNVSYYKVYDPIYPGGNLTTFDKYGNPFLSLQANTEIRIETACYPMLQIADDGAAIVETGSYWAFEYNDGYGNVYNENLYFRNDAMGFLH